MKKNNLLLICFAALSIQSQAQTVTDLDKNIYKTVTIGTQVWMAENLKVTHYRNGDTIPLVLDNTAWDDLTTGAYCYFNNDTKNVAIYGHLYNYYSVVDSRNLCPTGWHVPSDSDWSTLEIYLGGNIVAGGKLKEAGTSHWKRPNNGATNESGFSGLPGGVRGNGGAFWSGDDNDINPGSIGFWLASTQDWSMSAWNWTLHYNTKDINRGKAHSKANGLSVRCVRN